MAATVFYLDSLPAVGELALLDGAEGHHAATVRRIRAGERLLLSDRRGGLVDTVVEEVGRGRLGVRVTARMQEPPPCPRVTLVQALPKSDRAEQAVETATEAGADVIVPWQASRCVSRWDSSDKAHKGVAKWTATALTAARQSRRAYVPPVRGRHLLDEVVADAAALIERGGLAIALHESAVDRLADLPLGRARELMLIVGPEGGIDDRELESLVAVGARPALLGPTVLRTSTAAAVALGAIGVLTSRWQARPPH